MRVVDDEVIFSLEAPGAENVYLVGDFNNWNPTYEKLDKTDGRFERYLYLLPGTYRYKFVVDGNWIVDPDNPPLDPTKGSLLVLEERAGMLTLGVEKEVEIETETLLKPSARYAGAFFLDEGETNSEQALDVYVEHSSENVSARVNFKTVDESWDLSPAKADVRFDRGYLNLRLGDALLKGFENDTTWSSSDPFGLFGQVGIYDYNTGYERRGVSFETPLVFNVEFSAFYADKIDERPGPPLRVESESLTDFELSGASDTTVYRYRETFEDEDTWGVELFADAGSLKLGYLRREDRGFHPGLLAVIVREPGGFRTVSQTTREFWDADVVWLRWRFLPGLAASGAFGWGGAEVRAERGSVLSSPELGDLTVGYDTDPVDNRIPLQTSKRWEGALFYEKEKIRGGARYERNEFEFEEGILEPAEARISVIEIDAGIEDDVWSASGALMYIDQDYNETPDDFHHFTPARNFWLDYRDKLSVENIVAFDLEQATQVAAAFLWNRRGVSRFGHPETAEPTSAVVSGGLTAREFFAKIEYGFVRCAIEHTLYRGFFAQLDSRLAWYRKPSWDLEDVFFSTYLEGGYRSNRFEVSLGFGVDPVVLDPVANEYADIGRDEFLREARFEGLTRSRSTVLGRRLGEQERLLEDTHALKLELILLF
ncbi:MAG: glycogen-binding domain-containing protein [Candidatus Latescibacterota bacterium]|nr:MAG: glycogen-binding domain-containing protein [Candidatus Latescibacterota bacterium]